MLTYKTYADLSYDIHKNIAKIPSDIDLIVGIPRSGMIPAYILGQLLSLPVCSLNEFLSDNAANMDHAISMRINAPRDIKNVLIIDDTINSGTHMDMVVEKITTAGLDKKYDIKYATVYYSKPEHVELLDAELEMVPMPRLFQWNYLNHYEALPASAWDIDGLLCIDPTHDQNDDGDNYVDFLLNARPLHIPKYEVGALVTSRLEKYRKQTEKWLRDNGVKYKELYMLNVATAEERRRLGLHAKFKSEIFKKLPLDLFYESEQAQARDISILSGKPCFCTTTDELFINGKSVGQAKELNFKKKKKKKKLWRRLLASLIPNKDLRRKVRG